MVAVYDRAAGPVHTCVLVLVPLLVLLLVLVMFVICNIGASASGYASFSAVAAATIIACNCCSREELELQKRRRVESFQVRSWTRCH